MASHSNDALVVPFIRRSPTRRTSGPAPRESGRAIDSTGNNVTGAFPEWKNSDVENTRLRAVGEYAIIVALPRHLLIILGG